MNRLVSYSIILLLWVSSAFAQEKRSETQLEKPRLVVFVVGIDNAQLSDYVTNLISNNLSQSYTIIPRTDAIKKKMQELKEYEDESNMLIGNGEYEIPSLGSDDVKKAASALASQLQRKK